MKKKKFVNKFLKFFAKRLRWVVPMWYGLSMRLTRKCKTKVATYSDIAGIPKALDYGRDWRPDPLNEKLDVLMHPTKFQQRINKGRPGEKDVLGDCDDHAMYWCVTLLKSGLAAKVWFSSFQYWDSNDVVGGHAVCTFEDSNGQLWWADCHMPVKMTDRWDFAKAHASVTPIIATRFEIKKITKNDTPRFGKSEGTFLL